MNTQISELDTPSSRLDALPAQGVWAPPVTPVNADLSIDVPRWLKHMQWLLDSGCHGLALFGTTSEANSFSPHERMEMLEAAASAGFDVNQMMIGTGCCSIPETVQLTRHAANLGAKKVLMLPPYYYKSISDQGLFDHYSRVIDAVADADLKVFLYHFPKMSAVPISVELMTRLYDAYPNNVAGVKDSTGDWQSTLAFLQAFPNLAVFPGTESLLRDGLRNGGAGCITATANANPRSIRNVFDAWCSSSADIDTRHDDMHATRTIFNQHPAVPALKFVLARHHDQDSWRHVRPPMIELGETQGEQILKQLDEQGFQCPAG